MEMHDVFDDQPGSLDALGQNVSPPTDLASFPSAKADPRHLPGLNLLLEVG